jgi:hypothetical protein
MILLGTFAILLLVTIYAIVLASTLPPWCALCRQFDNEIFLATAALLLSRVRLDSFVSTTH